MLKSYYEVEVEGSLDLIKGYVLGFIDGRKIEGEAIFDEEHHVESEGKFGQLLRLLGTKGKRARVLVCCGLHDMLKEALENRKTRLPVTIHSVREILGASFNFEYKTFAEEYGKDLKKTFGNLPEGLVMDPGYEPKEILNPDAKGVEAYAPLHHYEIKAKGRIAGPIRQVMDFYGLVEHNKLIELGPIKLKYGD